jgi:hypothetical protein
MAGPPSRRAVRRHGRARPAPSPLTVANALEATLRHIAGCLDARHQGWALVGGLAISVRSDPRLTRDADLAVSVAAERPH